MSTSYVSVFSTNWEAEKGNIYDKGTRFRRGRKGQLPPEIELYDATVASCRIKSWENTVQSYAA